MVNDSVLICAICGKNLTHHQHIHTPLQNVESNLRHQIFFIKCGIYFRYFEAANFSDLHELAYKVFSFSFAQSVAYRSSGSFCNGRVEAIDISNATDAAKIGKIRSVRVFINVQANSPDLEIARKTASALTEEVKLNNY